MPHHTSRSSKPRLVVAAIAIGLSAGVAGCSTSADVAYGSYQFGPGYQTGSMHQSRVYGDTQGGVGTESCRTVLRQETDAFGRLSSHEETVCD